MMNRSVLIAESLSSLLASVFLLTSHYLQSYLSLNYFGHFLMGYSMLVLVTIPYNKWSRRLVVFNLLSVALNTLSFAGMLFGLIDELIYRNNNHININDSLFSSIVWVLYFWLFIYFFVIFILPFLRHRIHFNFKQAWRGWIPAIRWVFFLFSLVLIFSGLLSIFTKVFPPSYFFGPAFACLIYWLAFA
jgi:hypothetical protein